MNPSLVPLGVVEGGGEPQVALRVDGVVVDPVGDGRHRDAALEDVLSVLGQHRQGHETCQKQKIVPLGGFHTCRP